MESARALTPELHRSAARLLSSAFVDNPAHVCIFPAADTRASRLEWLLGANLKAQARVSRSFCLSEGHTVLAMGFWTRSHDPAPGPIDMMRAGVLAAPLRVGLAGLRRAGQVSRAIHREVELALGDQPHWYLNNMAVTERLRGRGVGGRLLEDQLHRVTASEPGLLVALSTQRMENVTFYERLGFRCVREETLYLGDCSFRNWTMSYAPAASRAVARPGSA